MLRGLEITAEAVKDTLQHGDALSLVEIRHHHGHDWSLFKARGAVRVEKDALEQHLGEIPGDRPIVVFADCPGEEASNQAVQVLLKNGRTDVHKLVGGFTAYLGMGLPVEAVSRSIPATRIMML